MAKSRAKRSSESAGQEKAPQSPAADRYVVVARRYRPQSFSELIGQDHVAAALGAAIRSNRVGHAYLFTGARGVGKTSTARIFAKALNCVEGPTDTPCNVCDVCRSIAEGGDVDVLEIDGASNRGIDEIRQLRGNVAVRPSRGRFKVYIIDEVHMLTKEAFNALLKTLEEPPGHVKFLFCTTDPEKIPITVLSRCQRFDLPPVETQAILQRLGEIASSEGVRAEPEALLLLARRANGSMRDSQSLLEQLLSFCGETITAQDVHAMLGSCGAEQLAALLEAIADRNAGAALHEVDRAVARGVDPGQLAEQLAGLYRDLLAVHAGCSADLLLHSLAEDMERLQEMAERLGMSALLASLQILDESLARMRQSPLARTLMDVAVVRLCRMQELNDLAEWCEQLRDGETPGAASLGRLQKKSSRASRSVPAPSAARSRAPEPDVAADPPAPDPPGPAAPVATDSSPSSNGAGQAAVADPVSSTAKPAAPKPSVADDPPATVQPAPRGDQTSGVIDLANAQAIWQEALATLEEGSLLAESAQHGRDVAISAPNKLVVRFPKSYNWHRERCERAESRSKLEAALQTVAGLPIQLEFASSDQEPGPAEPQQAPRRSHRQLAREAEQHPLVNQAMELFGAEVTRVTRRPPAG